MQIVIDNIEQFKVFFDVIYDVAELVELQFFPTKLICTVLDKSHSRFFNAEFNEEFFSIYDVGDGDAITIFVSDLHNLLKTSNKTDVLFLEFNNSYLICKFESKNGNSRIFELVLPTDYVESPSIPQLSFDVECEVSVDELKQSVKDLGIVKTTIYQITVSDDLMNVTTDASAWNKYSQQITVDADVESPITSKFNIDYIEQMIKFNKISKMVKMKLGNDFPLLYEFEDFVMGIKVTGLIAPRMEVD